MGSSVAAPMRGTSAGAAATSMRSIPAASRTPMPPPTRASRTLSASDILTSRRRLAPRAVRTDSSCWRVLARANMRFATFTQPIRRRSPTAPSKIQSAFGVVGPSAQSSTGIGMVLTFFRISGLAISANRASLDIDARVVCTVAPGASRAMAWKTKLSRRRRSGSFSVLNRSGRYTSTSSGQRTSGGRTPTIGRLIALSSTGSPTMSGREPNWLRQSRSEITTARAASTG